jgi:DNA-binding response OmpR family regulator
MLPGEDGLQLCRDLRSRSNVPIIMLTARGEETDRIIGLEMGADDYLAKPFSIPELLARLKALLRRVQAITQGMRTDQQAIESGGLHVDRLSRQVRLHSKVLDLTPREFDLLQHFVQHPERVFSRIELLNRVWGFRHEGYEHTVNTHINRLRSKIEPDPRVPSRIVTVWGAGYKFCLPAGAADAPE